MWYWRRMLRIPRNAFLTNKSVLEELGIVQARIHILFGYVSRRDNDSIELLVIQGRIEGTRSRGRSPMRWADQIKAAVAVPLHECARKAAAREEWFRIVKRATTLSDDHDRSDKSEPTEKKYIYSLYWSAVLLSTLILLLYSNII
ncbi:jg6762 [Pararge aegeria aegeria]|uniref:Jg6762 protein n=1 Tax=Pararge aegeria aegeria TaxID=348720 RepID=A0A8S4R8I5_9NEOP|nr:jg6762 [Pararge aegeria aegeria]